MSLEKTYDDRTGHTNGMDISPSVKDVVIGLGVVHLGTSYHLTINLFNQQNYKHAKSNKDKTDVAVSRVDTLVVKEGRHFIEKMRERKECSFRSMTREEAIADTMKAIRDKRNDHCF
jgi:hypothetical protein